MHTTFISTLAAFSCFTSTAAKENRSAKEESEIIPAAIIVALINGDILSEKGNNKSEWRNESVQQAPKKPFRLFSNTFGHVQGGGTCSHSDDKKQHQQVKGSFVSHDRYSFVDDSIYVKNTYSPTTKSYAPTDFPSFTTSITRSG